MPPMRRVCVALVLLAACAKHELPAAQGPVEVAALPPPAPSATAADAPAPEASAGPFASIPSASGPFLSPPFRVRAVFVVPATRQAPLDMFNGDRFLLFEAPTTCAGATGPVPPAHLETTAEAIAGSHSVFTQVSLAHGTMTSYRGSVTVVSVPKKPGKQGRVRFDSMPDGNVEGGEVEATWCW